MLISKVASYNAPTGSKKSLNINNSSPQTFTGWNIFKPQRSKDFLNATLESDIGIFSKKELHKLRKNVAYEVDEIISMPAASPLVKRLNRLLESPFIDYKTEYFSDNCSNLADKISFYCSDSKGSEMYRQFVLKSLSETMPLDLLAEERIPYLTKSNSAIKYILKSYSQMDEASPDALLVRKMVQRFIDAKIPVHNKENLCAEAILNSKPEMAKIYIKGFNFTPETSVEVLRENELLYPINFASLAREVFPEQKLLYDPVKKTRFFIVDPSKAHNRKRLNYFNFLSYKNKMSLYNLTGLSEDKRLAENFDIIPVLKAKVGEEEIYGKHASRATNAFCHFLYEAAGYHPEIKTAAFWEKYAQACNNISYMMSEVPANFVEKTQVEELFHRIAALKNENLPENQKVIDRLSQLYECLIK